MKNIFWFIIDSVRSKKIANDDRDRLEIMDKLDHDFANYKNAYTSAPSTIMSAAAMFSGQHTYKIARSYSDWSFNKKKILSIQEVLKESFNIFSIDNSKRAREMLRDLIGVLPKKFYKNFSHSENWSNYDVYNIFLNCFSKHSYKENNFYMCWFDCRHDPMSSIIIEKCLDKIKEKKLYDSSLIIINSDHGYPDTTTLNMGTNNLPHDLIMTEDNIKVPLLIKHPLIEPGPKENNVSLIDLYPTILDYCNVTKNLKKFYDGVSLCNKDPICSQNRFIRVDNRLLLQHGKVTTLINKNYKYYYYHDTKQENLYNLNEDPSELHNINDDEINYKKFKDYFNFQQKEFFEIHKEELKENFLNSLKNFNFLGKKILIFAPNIEIHSLEIVIDLLKKKGKKIYFLKNVIAFNNKTEEITVQDLLESTKHNLHKNIKFDFLIAINEKNYFRILDKKFFNICKKLNCNKKIFLDTNLNLNNLFFSKWIFPLLKYKKNWIFYKSEPKILIIDFIRLCALMFKEYIFKKKGITPRMEDIKLARDTKIKAGNLYNNDRKICIFMSNYLEFGGAQTQIGILNDLLIKKKYQTIFISLRKKDYLTKIYSAKIKEKINSLTGNYITNVIFKYFKFLNFFSSKKKVGLLRIIIRYSRYRKIFKSLNNYNVVISFLTKNNILILLCKFTTLIKKPKIILNERNNILKDDLSNFAFKLYLYFLKKIQPTLLTNSFETFEYFNKEKINVSFVLNNPPKNFKIGLEEFINKFKNPKSIIYNARYCDQKDQVGLLRIINQSKVFNSNYKLILFGRNSKGNFDALIKNEIKNLKLNDKVSLDKYEPSEKNIILSKYPIQIFNSKYEGLSNSLLESIFSYNLVITNRYNYELMKKIFPNEILDFLFKFDNAFDLDEILNKIFKNQFDLEKTYSYQKKFIKNYLQKNSFLSDQHLNILSKL